MIPLEAGPELAGHPLMAWHMAPRPGGWAAELPCTRGCDRAGPCPHWQPHATGPTIAAVLTELRQREPITT